MEEYALSSRDLENFIAKDENLLKKVHGIFPVDKIHCDKPSGKFFIINTDPSYCEGKHWVSIYFPLNSLPEFFDSLGKSPSFYSNYILEFLIQNSAHGFVYNSKHIQKPFSSSCGLYCLYFIYFRSKNYSYENILKKFNNNSEENDCIVKRFIIPRM